MGTEAVRSTDRFDRWLPWAFAAAAALVFFTLSWLRAHTLDAGFDLAYFKQAAWQLGHGRGGFLSVRGVHLFADHAYFVMYPIGWLGRIVPLAPLLLGLQATGLAGGVVPLYRLSREMAGLDARAAAAIAVVYVLHPAIQNANIFEFHPETVTAPVAFFGAVLFGHRQRWVPTAICVAVLLLSREDYVFVVAGLGVVHLIGRRWKVGAAMVATAIVWFAVVNILMGQFPGAVEIRASRLQPFGSTTLEAAGFLAGHPRVLLEQLTRPDNVDVAIGLLGPLLFLPLRAPAWLIPGLGLELLYLVSPVEPAHTIRFQYTLIPALTVTLAGALAIGRRRLTAAVAVPLLAASALFNLQLSTSSLQQHPWRWRHRDAIDRARIAAARVPPRDASVAASASILPLVAARQSAYFFPAPFAAYAARLHPPDPVPLEERISSVRYLLIDTTTIGTELHAAMIPDVLAGLTTDGTFERMWDDHGVEVWRRAPGS